MTESIIPQAVSTKTFAKQLAVKQAERLKNAASAKGAIPSGACWALGCNSNYKHIGLLFADKVSPKSETLNGGMCFSSLHELGQPYTERAELVCSQCFEESGVRMPLRVAKAPRGRGKDDVGFVFTIPERFHRYLHTISAARVREMMGLPEPDAKTELGEKVKEAGDKLDQKIKDKATQAPKAKPDTKQES